MAKKPQSGLSVKKNEDFSEWFTQIIQKAQLADLRYNVKGFLVFQPWSVLAMEKMFKELETVLQRKGHNPYWFPTVIPESNFTREAGHVKGFTPEVFWVTHGGKKKLEEKLALRPTSETAFYQMFNLWIRSYNDLPFKAYQRANVFRHETKATRPFLRSREFHWIETHCAHANEADAMEQVKEDMETTQEVLHDIFGLPFIFFQRPSWDTFPGAKKTFAADVLNPDGKVIQQPSTHMINPSFAQAFDIKYKDKDGEEKPAMVTCYGPAVSRIFASVIIVHGDDKGLKFPWDIAPKQIMIVPIDPENKEIMDVATKIKKDLQKEFSVEIDTSDKRPGEKFNHWEMMGIPVRIDIGAKDVAKKEVTLFRRDTDEKSAVKITSAAKEVQKIAKEFTSNLVQKADKLFEHNIQETKDMKELKKVIKEGGIGRCGFCSMDKAGEKCAEVIEKEINAEVRGTKLDEKDTPTGNCIACGKKAQHIAYIARAY